MEMTEVSYGAAIPIDSYGPGFFRVGGTAIHGAALIHATGARSWSGCEDLAPILALKEQVDFILFGTGVQMTPVPTAFRQALEAAGIGIEPMASDTACRTYNVLVSEGRRVAAAVLPL